ncbi:MAG: hypothetical protein LBC02_14910 [Planctomycetaceae bacterium]|jgi:hypothetical protein|nr:hypothetical protein [Planctomycetaceae bacterium]
MGVTFLWHTSLAKTIKQYDFFDYAVNEALFLSEKEEAILATLFKIFSRNITQTLIN